MRYNIGRRARRSALSGEGNSFWLSITDMRTGLLLGLVHSRFYSV